MKRLTPILFSLVLVTGCSGGGNNNNSAGTSLPPVEPPPVEPPPVDPQPPAMQSFAAFVRTVFADDADATPRDINGLEFNQDAADDDFSDLLQ